MDLPVFFWCELSLRMPGIHIYIYIYIEVFLEDCSAFGGFHKRKCQEAPAQVEKQDVAKSAEVQDPFQ